MEKIPACICVYIKDEKGRLIGQDYSLDIDKELGGMVPNVGDRIISPWVEEGANRVNPENRTVYEVVQRYFMQGNPAYERKGRAIKENPAWLVLVVTSRPGTEGEQDLFILI